VNQEIDGQYMPSMEALRIWGYDPILLDKSLNIQVNMPP